MLRKKKGSSRRQMQVSETLCDRVCRPFCASYFRLFPLIALGVGSQDEENERCAEVQEGVVVVVVGANDEIISTD